jgi:hypothetical protein
MGRDGSVHKLEPSSRIMDGSHMYKKNHSLCYRSDPFPNNSILRGNGLRSRLQSRLRSVVYEAAMLTSQRLNCQLLSFLFGRILRIILQKQAQSQGPLTIKCGVERHHNGKWALTLGGRRKLGGFNYWVQEELFVPQQIFWALF